MDTTKHSRLDRRTVLKGVAAAATGSLWRDSPAADNSVPRGGLSAPGSAAVEAARGTSASAAEHVNVSAAHTSWAHASRALMAPWAKPGGDYLDANGVLNGPKAARSLPVVATNTVDIGGLDGDLFVQGSNFDAPMIDGRPAVAFWVNGTSNRALPMPAQYMGNGESRGFILNPTRGKTLTFTCAQPGYVMRIDRVRGPAIVDLPMVPFEGARPPDLGTLDPISEAAVFAAVGRGAGAGPAPGSIWAYDPSAGTDAEHGNMPYLRLAITPANQKGIGWFWNMAPTDECYLRYAIFLEDSIAAGMTEAGVKLPGFEGVPGVSARMWHGPPDAANPHVYAAADYVYSGETPAGAYGDIHPFGQYLRAGRWYSMEQHVKNNTFKNGVNNDDGVLEMWINGHLVYSKKDMTWHAVPGVKIFNKFFVNIYHGGMGLPSRNIYYRIARLARSTTRIGPPADLLGRSAGPRPGR